jgi:hypothetical protein
VERMMMILEGVGQRGGDDAERGSSRAEWNGR